MMADGKTDFIPHLKEEAFLGEMLKWRLIYTRVWFCFA